MSSARRQKGRRPVDFSSTLIRSERTSSSRRQATCLVIILLRLASSQNVTASTQTPASQTTTRPLVGADTLVEFGVSRQQASGPDIQHYREILPQHFSALATSTRGPALMSETSGTRAPLPTTTTLTTNAMNPLEAVAPFDASLSSQEANRTASEAARATTSTTTTTTTTTTTAPTIDSGHLEQTNTIVVTNLAPESVDRQQQQQQTTTNDKAKSAAKSQTGSPLVKLGRAKFRCNNSDECQNGALCHNGTCFCLPGFTDDSCATNIDECRQFAGDELDQAPCLNDGHCVDEVNSFRCQCAAGYQGDRCELAIDLCADGPCQNGATCENHRTSYTCHCERGWTGANCELNEDDCARAPCLNNGTCRDLVADFACDCTPGFKGKQCQINVDECAESQCAKSSTLACIDLVNDYKCQCAPGFHGQYCQLEVDECSSAPCANGAKCIDQINSFECECADGWTGKQCEQDVNECKHQEQRVCHNGAVCENLEPSYKCHCRPGWTGRNCLYINDYCLAKQPCLNSGKCTNTNSTEINPFECECDSAFIGQRCETRRNCSNECDATHGHCVTSMSTCACQPTSEHAPRRSKCELISDCEQMPPGALCLNGGACISRPNGTGYECQCAPDFHGPVCQHEGPAESQLDLLLIVAICCVCFLLLACAILSVLVFRSVRKARATRGTYSPSTQEKFESNGGCGDLLKLPVPERLI